MEEKILEFLKEQLDLEKSLNLSDQIQALDEWDSLATLALMAMIDEEYDVILGQEDLEKMETIQDIVDFIKQNRD
jgi:acyl carrier protein